MPRATQRDSWRSSYNRGIAALGKEDFLTARTCFDSAIAAGADSWEPFYARAWATVQQLEANRDDAEDADDRDMLLAAAAQDLEKVLAMFPGCADGAALGGHVAALRGEREHAVELFLQALGRSSQVELVEVGLTDALTGLLADLEAKATDDAAGSIAACGRLESLVDAAPVIEPLRSELLAEILVTRAYCHQSSGDTSQTAADLRRVAQLVPQHPRIPESLPRASENGRRPQAPTAAGEEPTFESVGGIGQPGTFTETMRGLFEAYFGDPDTETVRSRLAAYGPSPTRCLLLFGPSGCGKTYIVRSLAGEYRKRYHRELPVIRLRLNQVYGKYVGESEKSITRLVDQAIETQPSILFADEVDAMGRSREQSGDWRIDIAAHWIQEVDRLRESNAAVVFFGCTNRIWQIDLAMIRRFDRMIPVEMPNAKARAEVFEACLRRINSAVRPHDLDVAELAELTHGWTPGDIQAAVNRSLDELLVSSAGTTGEPVLTQAGLLKALNVGVPRVSHVREWVQQSVAALRDIYQEDMAAEVERLYGPYIGGMPGESAGPAWQQIPGDAWNDQPQYELFSIRRRRG